MRGNPYSKTERPPVTEKHPDEGGVLISTIDDGVEPAGTEK